METIGNIAYDDTQRTLTRQTKIVAVDRSGTPIWSIVRAVLSSPNGLKIGLNLQSKHDLKVSSTSNKPQILWGVAESTAAVPTLTAIDEEGALTTELKNTFECDGKWFGFRIPQVASPPQQPVLYFETTVKNFKLKHRFEAYPAHIVAVEGAATFKDHFVMGLSVLTRGKNNTGVNFETTTVAVP